MKILFRPVFLVVSVLVISSCSTGSAPATGDSESASSVSSSSVIATSTTDLSTTTTQLWAGDDPYEMEYSVYCGESGWYTNGVVGVSVDEGAATVVSGVAPMEVATVERFLRIIREAERSDADEVSVTYDDRGVPIRIVIDYTENGIDDEFCARITELSFADGQ